VPGAEPDPENPHALNHPPIFIREGDWDRKPVEVVTNPPPPGAYEDDAEVVEKIVKGDDGEDRFEGRFVKDDYTALRRSEYPALTDQLDALWKGGDAAEAMRARVLAVKTEYPKS
jgi:hypothetical protein